MSRTLTVYLLKKTINSFEAALSGTNLVKYALSANVGFEGALYVQESHANTAKWVEFVEQGTRDKVKNARSQSSSAVLFVRAQQRVFAFTFGYGHHLLSDEAYEPHFGLRVALNLVDASRLRSVDAKTVEELTVYTRRQTSRSSPLGTFGLDVSQDLLRAVTGEPKDTAYAKRVTGKDALIFISDVKFAELGAQCGKLLKAFAKKDYQESFSWIDRLSNVRDPHAIEDLDELLIDALNKRQLDRLHMAPPDIVDWDKLHYFKYTLGGDKQEDLEPNAFLDTIEEVTLDRLKQRRIHGFSDDDQEAMDSWSSYKSLVFETEKSGKLYVLSGGLWYQVAKDFADKIASDLAKIKESSIDLPDAGEGDDEDTYNKRAADNNGYELLDKKLVRGSGASTPIEICDLLSNKGHLIHVKRHMRSATLSHLISQGVNSALALIGDPVFRKEARKRVSGSYAKFFPAESPDASNYEVAYAIIAKESGSFPQNLPFFSKLSLTRAAEYLRRLQFKVTVNLVAIASSDA